MGDGKNAGETGVPANGADKIATSQERGRIISNSAATDGLAARAALPNRRVALSSIVSGRATLGAKPTSESNPLNSGGREFPQQQTLTGTNSPEQIPAQMTDPDPDLKSMINTEKQQKTQEVQEAWGNLIKAMKESSIPFFAVSGSQEMLVLIKPTRDPSNLNSEIYVAITKDGSKAIQATKEAKEMINKLYLNPTEDPVTNRLEMLEMSPLLISETSDPISPVMKESQEMAAKIGEQRGEIKALETSINLARKLKGFFDPPQATPISS